MDRAHQFELRKRLNEFGDERPLNILAYVVPGGGKTRLPGILAERFPDYKIGWFVPRSNLRRQGVIAIKEHFNLELRDTANTKNPSHGYRGFITTHQALASNPDLWLSEFRLHPYIGILDEGHHAKIFQSGERNELAGIVPKLRSLARVWLMMTGTLETNDSSFIEGLHYESSDDGTYALIPEKSVSDPRWYIRYDRQLALDENAIVPITFFHHDGMVEWDDGNQIKKRRLSTLERDEEGAGLFTALQTHALTLFETGIEHYKTHGGRKLLVVTASQAEARKYHKLLSTRGIEAGLAITDEDDAQEHITRFQGPMSGLVTCAMAYEGMDVPDITHLICLTHIRSVPWIEQMLGRAWRQTEKPKRQCWAFVPDDPRMERVIQQIQAEQLPILRQRTGIGGNGNGGGNGFVLPISGMVDQVTESYLDEHIVEEQRTETFSEKLKDLLNTLGLPAEASQLEPYLETFRLQAATQITIPVQPPETTSDKEKALCKRIANYCRTVDRSRGVEFGTTQRDLLRRTKKSILEMNVSELQLAWRLMTRIWPLKEEADYGLYGNSNITTG